MLDSIGAIAPPRCHIGPAGPVTVNDGRRESDVTMDDHDRLAGRFEEHRSHLRAVAYRMLGSLTEADDAVQEAWLHLGRSGAAGVENLGGWLTTVVARVCLDKLRARRSRPEELAGVRLPDPIVDHRDGIDPEHQALLADAVGLALLVVLDTLRPAERVAFVLHDLFALPFTEIAPLLGRSVAATRQLASRARRRVRGAVPAPDADLGRQRAVVGAFLAASRDGDFDALMAVLDPEVVLRAEQAGTSTEVRGGPGRRLGCPRVRLARSPCPARVGQRGRRPGRGPQGTAGLGPRLHRGRREDRRDRHPGRPGAPRPARPGGPRRLTLRRSVGAVQLGGKVVLEGLADGGHVDGVPEPVAVEVDVAVQGLDPLGRGRAGHGGAAQLDPGAVQAALLDLDDAGGVGQDQLDRAARLDPPVAALGVEGAAVVQAPGPLGIGQERLADVPEPHLLAVAERRDGRVPAGALAPPGAEQAGQRLELRVQRRCRLGHGAP
jgi:RNA polymerase sigma factor (sigma-70 family)